MANDLKMEVILQAIDRATRPIRAITEGSGALAKALKANRDQLKSLNDLQRDISSYKKQHTAVRETSESLAKAQQRLREMREQLKGMNAPSAAFQRSFINATKEVDRLSRKHREQRTELQQTITRFREAGISTASLKDREKTLGGEIDAVNRKMKVQRDRLAAVALQQERLGKAKQQYQRTQALAGSMAGSGASGLASGSSILYAGARLLTPGIDYGAQMSELQAITRLNKEDERFKALKAQARELGASTAFSASEVGAGQTFLARAGFTPEAIRASMEDILSLALANNTDLARTADIASNISSAFKINPEVEGNITRVTDLLSGTAARANVNLEMLGETMKYMGSAEGLGLTLEQAAAMSGLLGNIGIQSSQAGTTMRAMLNRLSAPVGAATKSIAALGLQIANAEGNMRDIPDLLGEIARKTKDMGNVERAAHLKAIFGEEAGSGMAELISQKGLGGLDKLLQELMQVQGENVRMASTMADNISGDLKGLRSAWEEVGITVADTNEGPLRDFIQGITGVVRGIGAWMNENPRLTAQILKTVAGLGMLLAIGGGITVMLASVIGPFAMVRYGLMLMASQGAAAVTALKSVGSVLLWISRLAMANPIGLLITALVVGAVLIYKNWDAVKAYMLGLWAELKAGFSGGIGDIAKTIINFSPLGLFHRVFAGVMSYFGVELPAKFTEFGGMIMSGLIKGIKNAAGAVKDTVVGAATGVVDSFKEKLGIHSPSRVFAELGGFTMQGLEKGLLSGQSGPLGAVLGLGKQLAAAGAITFGAAGSAIAMDNRPPLGSQSAPRVAQVQQAGPITIHVHAAPGMDEQQLARAVAAELAKAQRAQQARSRSALSDQE
ncbi:phage tail tape measure protein [Pseudomonas mendocina]|uniref:phage tail tape measure protein n=1 Tax=Ectopseudomonas mendocina TaxID=300 RepID=UPI0023DC9C14|nr:phage tail tape measure protein [Pseudomonas mendocina]MDF2073180.1 phage tail tape measure protein [Pseudomonas mendocina]